MRWDGTGQNGLSWLIALACCLTKPTQQTKLGRPATINKAPLSVPGCSAKREPVQRGRNRAWERRAEMVLTTRVNCERCPAG